MIQSSVFLFFGLILIVHEQTVYACLGSGVCGGGGGCAPPPPVSCGGCSQGYSCGHYGCSKNRVARAHGSNTINIDEHTGLISEPVQRRHLLQGPRNPNQMFMECCEARNLPDGCLQKCNFNTYTKESLMAMYFKTDNGCPIEAASELQYCAAQGRDHRSCCIRQGVHTTLAGEKCLTFCDQRPGNVTQLDFSYAACYDKFENMKGCFWHSALIQ